ncbi:cation-translocating P-type ATPase [bacterium]|nr:cation-translocating P-type ATPase [bacterium]
MLSNKDSWIKILLNLNITLCLVLLAVLVFYLFNIPIIKEGMFLQIVAIVATIPVLVSALVTIKNKNISIDLLASIALVVSLYEKEWMPAIFINLMIASARIFSAYVKIKSHSAINSLLDLKPKMAKIERNGKLYDIPLEEVVRGDTVVIELGERIPVDGVVLSGEASIDQSSLTGESVPVFKKEGDSILSFTTVVSGHLIVRADKIGKETTFERIIALIEQAQANKSPIYSFINEFVKWYIILTLSGAIIVYIFSGDIGLVISLLLVSCADDIAVATPIALMSAITHSARHGVIIKGGDYLNSLAKVKVIVFDKTGTLTQGKMKIEKVICFNKSKESDVIFLAAIPSSCSSHPISHAIIEYSKEKDISIYEVRDFEEYGGKGISATYNGKKIVMGKKSFLQEMKVTMKSAEVKQIDEEISEGFNVSLVAYDGKLVGCIALADRIREGLRTTICQLKILGVERTVMLTGDNEKAASRVAKEAGIDEYHANLLPADKLEKLKTFLSKDYKVAMVGDGVNDAPGLALSDVGIAMGAIGSDASVEAADIALMKDDLSQIPELIRTGRSTVNVIRQNIIVWAVLNILGFFLVFAHILNPSGAAAYNFICDFIPIINSLRLFK